MTPIMSNSLADLADRIRAANEAVLLTQRTTAEKAIEGGRLLVQAKAQCDHGEWLPFLERAGVKERRARQWMEIANSGLQIGNVADLGIRGTLEFLARWRLPKFDEALCISDARLDLSDASDISGRGLAYIWEDDKHRGHYHIGAAYPDGDGEETWSTRRPMLPRIGPDGEDRPPLDTLLAWLTHDGGSHFPLPIEDWKIEFCDRRFPLTIWLPYWTGIAA